MSKEKNLELDRLVFFSDAVVAIAITLLALDLKINRISTSDLTFADLGDSWQKFLAFFLSFYMISIFWRVHHLFFTYINAIDMQLLRLNLCWLLCIVLLPFTTSLMSRYFQDTPAVFMYCLDVLLVTVFQNLIWNYAIRNPELLNNQLSHAIIRRNKYINTIALVITFIATGIALLNPLAGIIAISARAFTDPIEHIISRMRINNEQH